jgi:hypothetical protein
MVHTWIPASQFILEYLYHYSYLNTCITVLTCIHVLLLILNIDIIAHTWIPVSLRPDGGEGVGRHHEGHVHVGPVGQLDSASNAVNVKKNVVIFFRDI